LWKDQTKLLRELINQSTTALRELFAVRTGFSQAAKERNGALIRAETVIPPKVGSVRRQT